MIKGLGIDLIEIERIKNAIERPGFLERYFTINEIEFFKDHKFNPQKVASNFTTKEAVVKAFGTGFRKIRLIDIEVLRDPMGKPYVNLYDEADKTAKLLGIESVFVSISNTKTYVTAVAVGEGEM